MMINICLIHFILFLRSLSLLITMELNSLLHDLHLCSSSEKPLPSAPVPPITELLSQLQEKLIGASSATETNSLIRHVEQLFRAADPDWLFSAAQAELQASYVSLISALIGCAALPRCEDDCSSLPAAAYQSVPNQAIPVCSTLRALLGTVGKWERGSGAGRGLLLAVAPPVCVFAVTHFQVSVSITSLCTQTRKSTTTTGRNTTLYYLIKL